MTGWRLGYGIMPEELVPHVSRLGDQQRVVRRVVQPDGRRGGVGTGPQDAVQEMAAEFGRRRRLIADGLQSIPGINCPEPEGAFYAFPSIKETGLTSAEFEDRAMQEAGVALLSGRGVRRVRRGVHCGCPTPTSPGKHQQGAGKPGQNGAGAVRDRSGADGRQIMTTLTERQTSDVVASQPAHDGEKRPDATVAVKPRLLSVAKPYRFTVEQYLAMGKAGILGKEERVELLEGVIVAMAAMGKTVILPPWHDSTRLSHSPSAVAPSSGCKGRFSWTTTAGRSLT